MKKLMSILLALALVLSLSITAFADEETNVTFTNTGTNRTYDAYQLMELTVSLKTGEHHPAACDSVRHSDDCYNYAYTINEKYLNILKQETHDNAGQGIWGDANKPAVDKVTEKQILDYLASLTSDSTSTYGTLRRAADRIYRAIAKANLDADKTGLTDKATIDKGYWMFVDNGNYTNEEDASSLVILDTKGEDNLTVAPKISIPEVEKKVKDIEDSTDANITDNPWQDSADHDIDDVVPFKLTASLPSNLKAYETYKLIFHDTLSAGLTLNTNSVKVLMYQTKHKADADIRVTVSEGTNKDVTGYFTVTEKEDGSFEVTCDDIKKIVGVDSGYAFVVYYEATLNEKAVIGAAGNPNEVYLEFSNNPYVEDSTGKTEKDKVTVFTYQLTINKTDSHSHPLAGAGFTLKKLNQETGEYVAIGDELKGDNTTTFVWKGLDDGDYELEETTVPEGYNELTPVKFSIIATHSESADDPKLLTLDGGLMGTGDVTTGIIEKNIVNNTGSVLPETGAKGTMFLITGSTLLVMVAVVFLVTRKKMSIYED